MSDDTELEREAEALALALEGDVSRSPHRETLEALVAHRADVEADLARVRRRVVRRPMLDRLRVAGPVVLALAAAAAILLTSEGPEPAPMRMPEPDVALLEAQVRAATERGLRTDLDVEAWRYRRRVFATLEGRYAR